MAPIEEKTDASKKASEEEEDTPLVKQLKELDDKYLALEREYEREERLLRDKFSKQQKPLLEKRLEVLKAPAASNEDPETAKLGTPAIRAFWAQALHNHEDVEEYIQEWDMPVLEYLQNIVAVPLSAPEEADSGFRLEFHFIENPYFEQTLLTKEYHTVETSPYTGEVDVKEIKATEITWKAGKDVTVELVKKKVKGGGAKKAKQAKEKAEPRDSFFRNFFTSLKEGEPMPDSINVEALKQQMDMDEDMGDDDDDERLLGMLMENDHSCGDAIQKNIIPYAVRWYTGEAAPEDSDMDEEDEEEDEDDDDDDEEDDDDESEEEVQKPAKGSAKSKPKAKAKAEAKEECKQQ